MPPKGRKRSKDLSKKDAAAPDAAPAEPDAASPSRRPSIGNMLSGIGDSARNLLQGSPTDKDTKTPPSPSNRRGSFTQVLGDAASSMGDSARALFGGKKSGRVAADDDEFAVRGHFHHIPPLSHPTPLNPPLHS